jgi:hypothetical protein
VVHVPGEQHVLALERGVATLEHADHVGRPERGQRDGLEVGGDRHGIEPAHAGCLVRTQGGGVDAQRRRGRRIANLEPWTLIG